MGNKGQQPASFLFHHYAEHGPGIALVDENHVTERVNLPLCRMLGYSQSEFNGMFFGDVVLPDHGKHCQFHQDELRSNNGAVKRTTRQYRHKNGQAVWVAETISMVPSELHNGMHNLLYLVEELTNPNGTGSPCEIVQHMPDGLVITDENFHIIDINPAFSSITGYDKGEVVGHPPLFLQSDRHSAHFYRRMFYSIKKDGYWQGEIWKLHKNGKHIPLWLRINTLKAAGNKSPRYIGVFSDIRNQIELREDLLRRANHDPLTGLPNRLLFYDRTKMAMRQAKRSGRKIALLFVDLDRFKAVNDSYGHSTGDSVLIEITRRLKNNLRDVDTMARFGGDEFAIMISDLDRAGDAAEVAEKLLAVFRYPLSIEEYEISITASIGISIYPDDTDNVDHMLCQADSAMYQIKRDGCNNYRFFQARPKRQEYQPINDQDQE